MGCDTCKQKNQKEMSNNENETLNVNFVPKSVQEGGFENGSFIFKLIAFIVILISLPLILSVLIIQMFLHFFLPKFLPKVSKKVKDFFIGIINFYGKFKYNREIKKRKKQFDQNLGYEKGSDLVEVSNYKEEFKFDDIEVHENNNDTKK